MKDWKASIRTWEKRNNEDKTSKPEVKPDKINWV